MIPHRPFDPTLLDAIERSLVEWSGMAYRQVFAGTDVLRANIRGARWNPPGEEAVYCSLRSRTAAAEIDHLIAQQPVPILTPRITHKLSVTLARVVDLRNLAVLESCDITPEMVIGEDLSTPQLVGGAVAWLQCAPPDVMEPVSYEEHAPVDQRR